MGPMHMLGHGLFVVVAFVLGFFLGLVISPLIATPLAILYAMYLTTFYDYYGSQTDPLPVYIWTMLLSGLVLAFIFALLMSRIYRASIAGRPGKQ
jgi:cell shape-determining protein MreD